RTRPRIRGDRGTGLDPGRGRTDHAGRSGSENPAYGLEHSRRVSAASVVRRHRGRSAGSARLFRAFVPPQTGGTLRSHRRGGLRRPGYGGRRPPPPRRPPGPSRKKPTAGGGGGRPSPSVGGAVAGGGWCVGG